MVAGMIPAYVLTVLAATDKMFDTEYTMANADGTGTIVWKVTRQGEEEYTLEIDGVGAIPNKTGSDYPWYDNTTGISDTFMYGTNNRIKHLIIGEDVTNFPNFGNGTTSTYCPNIETVVVNSINFEADVTRTMQQLTYLTKVSFTQAENILFSQGCVFAGCGKNAPSLTLELPATLRSFSIFGNTFEKCTNFKTVTIPEENQYFSVVDNVLYNKDKTHLVFVPTNVDPLAIPVSTVERISACYPVDYKTFFNQSEIDDNIEIKIKHYKDGIEVDNETNPVRVAEMLKAEVTAKEGELPDDLCYAWVALSKSNGTIDNSNSQNVAGFDTTDTYLDGQEYQMSPNALYGAVKKNFLSSSGTKYGLFIVCRNIGGVMTVVAQKEFKVVYRAETSDDTYGSAGKLKYIADGNYVTMIKGETRSINELLGRCGVTHVTCSAVTVSQITNKNSSPEISVSGSSITANEVAENVEVGFSISGNCTYHKVSDTVTDNTIYINIIELPEIDKTCTSITVNNPLDGYDYFVGQKKGVVGEDGKIHFTGLKVDTDYVVRMQITDPVTGAATYSYADTVKTSAHDFTGDIKDNGDGTHSYLCKNGCGTYGGKTNHVFTDGECECGALEVFDITNATPVDYKGTNNGYIEINKATATKGETVAVTVTPSEGYRLASLTYNDGTSDTTITATGGVYSFNMPTKAVTVTATFTAVNYTVTDGTTDTNGSITIDKATANMGDTVTITDVAPSENYKLKSLVYNDGTGDTPITATEGGVYSFTMPAANVTVTATFEFDLDAYKAKKIAEIEDIIDKKVVEAKEDQQFKNWVEVLEKAINDATDKNEVDEKTDIAKKVINEYIPEPHNVILGGDTGATLTKAIDASKSFKYEIATVTIKEEDGIRDGSWFVYWTDKEGNIVSTYSTYSFYVVRDIELTPVYVSPNEYDAERAKGVLVNNIVRAETNNNGTVTIFTEHSASQAAVGNAIGQHGIIYTTDLDSVSDLKIGSSTELVKTISATKTNTSLTGLFRTTVNPNGADKIYAVTFITDAKGNTTYGKMKEIEVAILSANSFALGSLETALVQAEEVLPAEAPAEEEPAAPSFTDFVMSIINAVIALLNAIIGLF